MASSLLLWLIIILSLELVLSRSSATSLALCVGLAISISATTLSLGMELIATTIILFFCATALVLFLLMLSVEGHSRLGANAEAPRTGLALALMSLALGLCAFFGSDLPEPSLTTRWWDSNSSLQLPASNLLSTISGLLVRFFIAESLMLNILLTLCFLCAIALMARTMVLSGPTSKRLPASLRAKRSWRRFSSTNTR